MTAAIVADDLFAGAGGWDLAAEALGIHARGIENMPAARATREAAGLTTVHDDVWTYEPDGTAELLIASPPCQTFSAAGKGAGRAALDTVLQIIPLIPHVTLPQLRKAADMLGGEERTALVLTPLWFAVHGSYRALAWEQVKEVLPVWEACADLLRTLGWNVVTGRLNAEQYGVPQTRKRAFLLASLDNDVALPTPTHSLFYPRSAARLDEGVLPWVSMASALGWGMTASPSPCATNAVGRGLAGGSNSRKTLHREREEGRWLEPGALRVEIRRSGDRIEEGFDPAAAPSQCVTSRFNRWQVKPAIAGETEADCAWVDDRPSPTVVGTFAPDVVAAPGYRKAGDPPRQKTPGSVRVTVAEAAVLQSFPADFPWQGTKGQQYLQCGNAVPPVLALHALATVTGQAVRAAGADDRDGAEPSGLVVRTGNFTARDFRGQRGVPYTRSLDAPAPTAYQAARWVIEPSDQAPEEQTA